MAPAFIIRPENPKECICTRCFLTVRITAGDTTLEKAQTLHKCDGIDLKAILNQV